MKLSLISKYRTQFMGIAMLWVVFFHSHINIENSLLSFIKRIGYGGVDIFMFVSGFGVYFAINNTKSTLSFYKKRLIRILPYYYPIMLISTITAYSLNVWDMRSVLHNIFLSGFWFNLGLENIFDWYIPALLSLYLISPLFYKLYKKNKFIALICFIPGWYVLSYTPPGSHHGELFSLTLRAPLYFLGFWLADIYNKKRDFKINKAGVSLLIILLILSILILYYTYYYTIMFQRFGLFMVPFFIFVPSFCILIGYVFSLFKDYKFPILSFFGTYSLTIYIFHERIQFILETILGRSLAISITAILIAILLAYYWQKLVSYFINSIEQKNALI